MAHSHNHGGGHSHNETYPDDDWNLYQHLERADVLNAVVLSSGEGETTSWAPPSSTGKARCLFKPHARRLQPGSTLSSDSDEQIIVKVQFAAPISVRKLMATQRPDVPSWQRQGGPPPARGALAPARAASLWAPALSLGRCAALPQP